MLIAEWDLRQVLQRVVDSCLYFVTCLWLKATTFLNNPLPLKMDI